MKKMSFLVLLCALSVIFVGCKSNDYQKATELYDAGSYEEAEGIFDELGDYEDSEEMAVRCQYEQANALYEEEKYEKALSLYENIAD